MKKKLLLVSKTTDAKEFISIFEKQGVEVHQIEVFKEALTDAKEWKPGVIVFLVPVYWESILDFVKEIRDVPEMKKTEILYIGKLIEGAELTLLQKYNVKTMALGPVPKEEMARFIYGLFPAW
jgi:DNA-binding response OmpR family regulator